MLEGTYTPPLYLDLYNFHDGAQNDIFENTTDTSLSPRALPASVSGSDFLPAQPTQPSPCSSLQLSSPGTLGPMAKFSLHSSLSDRVSHLLREGHRIFSILRFSISTFAGDQGFFTQFNGPRSAIPFTTPRLGRSSSPLRRQTSAISAVQLRNLLTFSILFILGCRLSTVYPYVLSCLVHTISQRRKRRMAARCMYAPQFRTIGL